MCSCILDLMLLTTSEVMYTISGDKFSWTLFLGGGGGGGGRKTFVQYGSAFFFWPTCIVQERYQGS